MTSASASSESSRAGLRLAVLVGGLALLGGLLAATVGPPPLPTGVPRLPTLEEVELALRSPSGEQVAGALAGLTWLAWLVWGWLAASAGLRVLVVVGERLAAGAAWVRSLRTFSDLVTLPAVRRAVDASLAGLVLVRVAGSSLAPAAAFASESPAYVEAAGGPTTGPPEAPPSGRAEDLAAGDLRYTVQPGDSLGAIAERFYGDWTAYTRIYAANRARPQPDGRLLEDARKIYPGWTLVLPAPTHAIDTTPDGQVWYTVQPGDSLSRIAAGLLGAPERWEELFALNRGVARTPDGQVLAEPDLIWPGLRLRLPGSADRATLAPAPAVETAAAQAPTVLVPPPPEPTPQAPEPAAVESPSPPAPPTMVGSDETVIAVEPEGAGGQSDSGPAPVPLAAGVGGIAALGAAAFLARRARRRPGQALPAGPESDVEVAQGFAQADPSRELTRSQSGEVVDLVSHLAEQLLASAAERGASDATLITALQGRSATTLTFGAPAGSAAALVAAAEALGQRAGASVRCELNRDGDLEVRVAGLGRSHAWQLRDGQPSSRTCPMPLGVVADRRVLFGELGALGHVLVTDAGTGAAGTILTSLVATLAARRTPADLALHLVGPAAAIPVPLAALPHVRGVINDAGPETVAALLQGLEEELRRRAERDAPTGFPPVVVALWGLGALAEAAAVAGVALERIGREGPRRHVHLLAAADHDAALDCAALAHFTTRLVLRTPDERRSMALLGLPDAVDLGGGGRYLLRIEGRQPVAACGFRASPEALEALSQRARRASGERPAPPDAEPTAAPGGPVHGPDDTGLERAAAEDGAEGDVSADGAAAGQEAAGETLETEHPPGAGEAPAAVAPSVTLSPVTLEVVCFGGPRVLAGGRQLWPTVEAKAGLQKPWELLVFLACQSSPVVPRERVLAALWPEADEDAAAGRLKSTLYLLRSTLAERAPDLPRDVVRSERDGTCRLDTAAVTSDVQRFLALIQAARTVPDAEAEARLREACALYGGDLFGERAFEWVHERDDSGLTPREQLRELYRDASGRLAALYERGGRYEEAARLYQELLRSDPLDEAIVRALMTCYARAGDRAGLLRTEKALRQALNAERAEDEDPWEPEPETVDLFEHLMAGLEAREGKCPRA